MWICRIFKTHLSFGGHLDWFYFLELWLIMNNAAKNICLKCLCGHVFPDLLGLYLGVELCDNSLFHFWGTARLFSKGAAAFYYPVACSYTFKWLRSQKEKKIPWHMKIPWNSHFSIYKWSFTETQLYPYSLMYWLWLLLCFSRAELLGQKLYGL